MTPPPGARFTLIWEPPAIAGLIRLRQADPATAKDVRAAVLALARDPEPDTSSPLGTAGLRRIRLFLTPPPRRSAPVWSGDPTFLLPPLNSN